MVANLGGERREFIVGQVFLLSEVDGEIVVGVYVWELLQELRGSASRWRVGTGRPMLVHGDDIIETLVWRLEGEEATIVFPTYVFRS